MTEPAAEGLPHTHREPGEGDAVAPKPFIRNGLLFLPDGVYCATAVRLASIESIGIEYDEDDDACTAVTMASGSVHHTDLDWFGSVLEIWETAAWEEAADAAAGRRSASRPRRPPTSPGCARHACPVVTHRSHW